MMVRLCHRPSSLLTTLASFLLGFIAACVWLRLQPSLHPSLRHLHSATGDSCPSTIKDAVHIDADVNAARHRALPRPTNTRLSPPSPPSLHKPGQYHLQDNPAPAQGSAQEKPSPPPQQRPRANAAFVILLQNKDFHDMRKTMRMLEWTFNRHYGYPYVFLNNEPFTEHFKTHIRAMTPAPVKFGLIPKEHWSYPAFINQTQAALNRKDMENRNVPYGDSESYRHMCRYESGFIFRHELVQEYNYFWRVEPGVSFNCDLDIDPFMFMKTKKIKYGFTIALPEYVETIPTLWDNVKRFMTQYPEHIAKRNSLEWISYDKGDTYNNCHFWSNFEIVDLSFFRSKAYMDFFSLLDATGGFFYERWGDAPVHSIAAALMLDPKEIHFFNEIGYRHGMYEHCPESPALQLKCSCNPKDNVVNYCTTCTALY